MYQDLSSAQLALCLSLCGAALSCDGSSAPSPPAGTNLSQAPAAEPTPASRGTLSQGSVSVEVIVNHSPQVIAMKSSAGRVESTTPVTLQVVASDPDGDTLSLVWKSTCPGSFDRSDLPQVTFTAGDLSGAAACSFTVEVTDGHGGLGAGTLVLSTVPPKIDIAPQIGIGYQSPDKTSAGGVVILHATATDPEGEALIWTWKADDGELSHQVDSADSSEVEWTAPAAAGTAYTVTATATDPEGASASFVFTVPVVD